jgi:hypothetical protein
MTTQTTQPFVVSESCSAQYTALVQDETGAGIPAASINTLTLTLYAQPLELASPGTTAAIINSRSKQDILNTNGCTSSSSGALVMTFSPADNVIVGSGQVERHVALFEYTYAATTKAGKEEVLIDVINLSRTT